MAALKCAVLPTPTSMLLVLRERAIGILTAGMSTRAVARKCNVYFTAMSRLQCCLTLQFITIHHSTGHNQFYTKRMCCTDRDKWQSDQILFLKKIKLSSSLEGPFIETHLRYTCVIIMLCNQHIDKQHLSSGWIYLIKMQVLTNTDSNESLHKM